MREIKFRAWQPFTSLHRKKGMYVVDDMVWHRVTEHQPNAGEVFLAKNIGWSQSSEYFEDVEIMQFTGLKDKNGVEVCEGDIGLIGTTQHTVCWNEAGAFFDLAWENRTDMDTDFLLSDAVNGFPMFEVIGNRFENPELLEVTS